MKIAIDARAASHPQPGGFKTYVTSLIQALGTADSQNDYTLYLDRPLETDWGLPPNFHFRIVGTIGPLVGAGWREQWVLPHDFCQNHAQLMHFPCNTGAVNPSFPFVLTLHDVLGLGNPYIRLTRPLRKYLWSAAQGTYQRCVVPPVARRARVIITVSEYEKTLIVAKLGVKPDQVCVTYLGVNKVFRPLNAEERETRRLELQSKYGLHNGYILCVGSKPSKNILGLIEAFGVLRQSSSPSPDLVLVIPHPVYEQSLRAKAQELGLGPHVKFLPALSQHELVPLYGLAELFAFPSFRESFGLPPLEAMACGTPVVLADSSCLPEAAGDAAFFVNPHDIESVAFGMRQVLENAGLAAQLRERGLRRAREFSWEKTARRTIQVYESVFRRDGATFNA